MIDHHCSGTDRKFCGLFLLWQSVPLHKLGDVTFERKRLKRCERHEKFEAGGAVLSVSFSLMTNSDSKSFPPNPFQINEIL